MKSGRLIAVFESEGIEAVALDRHTGTFEGSGVTIPVRLVEARAQRLMEEIGELDGGA